MRDFLTYAEYRAQRGLSSYLDKASTNVVESHADESKISKLIKKQLEKFANAKEGSVFTSSQINSYIKKQTGLTDEEILLHDSEISSFVQKLNDSTSLSEGDMTSEDILMESLNTIFDDETVIAELDSDNNGKLSDIEKADFLNALVSANENNNDSFSFKDLMTTIQGIMGGMSLEDAINQTQAASFSESPAVEQTGSNPLSKPNTHSSNYERSSGELVSYQKENDLNAINEKIGEARNQIIEKNNQKAEIMKADQIYTQKINDLNNVLSAITQGEANVAKIESEIHKAQFELTSKTAELANLAEPQILDDLTYKYTNETGAEAQGSFADYKANLEREIQSLQETITTKTGELSQAQTQLNEDKAKETTLKGEIQQYEAGLNNEDINTINSDIADLEKTIEQYEADKKAIQEQLNQQRSQEISDAEVVGKNDAFRQSEFTKFMLDYATDPATKAYYDKWYYEHFNGKAYCAVFTSNVVEVMYAKVAEKLGLDLNMSQGVNGNQFSMESQSWGKKIQAELNARGIDTIPTFNFEGMSKAQKAELVRQGMVYPGMVFEYTDHNGSYHTGFIESINDDLSYNTIEGNVQIKYEDGTIENHTVGAKKGGKVEEHSTFSGVTDPTVKVLCWLKDLGYPDSQINALLRSKM